MPVDKFGRNGDRKTTVYTGINIANLTYSFVRRDGSNTAIGAIDLNSNIIKGELISTSSPMFATEWPGFHKFSRGPSLITFFSGSLLVVGHGIFASIILNYRRFAL